ncbi:hypothetical protein Tco_0454167 [Tanacetum coccineum]
MASHCLGLAPSTIAHFFVAILFYFVLIPWCSTVSSKYALICGNCKHSTLDFIKPSYIRPWNGNLLTVFFQNYQPSYLAKAYFHFDRAISSNVIIIRSGNVLIFNSRTTLLSSYVCTDSIMAKGSNGNFSANSGNLTTSSGKNLSSGNFTCFHCSYLHAVASEWKVLQYQWKPAGGKYTYVGRLYLTCGNHSTKQKLKERIKSLSGKIDKDKIKQDFEEIETINIELDHRVTKLIAENEHLKQTYKQLYDSIKPARIRSKEQCDDLINQVNIKSREISNLNASLLEKALAITILKDELRKLKGKALDHVVEPKGTAHVQHSKLNANSSLKCVKPVKKNSKRKVWKPTGKVFTNIGYIWRPTSRTFTIVGNAFPLTRITITTEVPLRKSSALDNKTPKPVITLVYSRKPRKSKTSVPVNNYKVIKFVTANNLESSRPNYPLVFGLWLVQAYETIHIDFDELTAMASKHSSSGPALHEMTPATISSGLVPNPHPSTPFIPPSRTDWDMLFQPLFDEFLNPSPSVDHPANKDAPSPISISAAYYMSIALFCLIRCFPHTVEPKTYKVALYSRLVGFEAMQEELNEFERLEVWELIPRPDKISQNPRGIFINQSKYALESLKKYSFDSCDPVDTPMVEKSKLDEDKEGKAVDPSHYCENRASGDYGYTKDSLFASNSIFITVLMLVVKIHAVARLEVCNFWVIYLLAGRLKGRKALRYPVRKLNIFLCPAIVLKSFWMRSQLTDYGFGFNKIPMYYDNKSALALCCNNVQHSRSKHIDIIFHFIKEHVENGVIELYFVNTEYQLADIFTKALGRNRIEFLINKLGMRSFTPETLKKLADEVDE